MTRRPIDASRFRAVDSTSWYSPADVARLFGRATGCIVKHCREGKIESTRDPLDKRSYRIRGSVILRMAAELILESDDGTETDSERSERASAAIQEIAAARGGVGSGPTPSKGSK